MALDSDKILENAISEALGDADPGTVQVITAVTGLLAAVAYSDRKITDDEASHLKNELGRINGLSKSNIEVVAQTLHQHALPLSASFVQRFTRTLREELDEEMRAEVLDALLGMAAADGEITYDEVARLRNITTGLGLSQVHYNALQEKYRDKLALS